MTNIAPWLPVGGATAAVEFYRAAFGAAVGYRAEVGDGHVVVAHLSVDGCDFWIQDDPAVRARPFDGQAMRIILSVDDPDAVYAAALAAGATAVTEVYEGHGWRIGRVADPSGHHWEIGRPLGP